MRLWTSMGDGKMQWKEKVLRVNVDKTKGIQLLLGKKSSVLKVDPCGFWVRGLVVILFSVRNVRCGFIVVVLMCLGRLVYYHVGMSF